MLRSDLEKLIGKPTVRSSITDGSEDAISVAFANWLRNITLQGQLKLVWFHVANQIADNKSRIFGARLKRMGKHSGIPDYIFLGDRVCFALELKTATGRLSENQEKFRDWCIATGVKHYIAYGLEEAIKIVESYLGER